MRTKLDARDLFKCVRITLNEMNSTIKSALRRKAHIELFDEDFRELRNSGASNYVINGWNLALSVVNGEIALFTATPDGLRCYWSYLDDYDMKTEFEYDSRRFDSAQGSEAYRILARYHQIPKINEYKQAPLSAYQLLYKSNKYKNVEVKNAVCYDRNSSFPAEMLNSFIDFYDLGFGEVEDGMIGFNEPCGDAEPFLPITGAFADHRFRLIDVPDGVKKFVETWYDKKKNATSKKERNRAKQILNNVIGYFQNRNWAYRALIVAKSNEFIFDLIERLNKTYGECVIYANTDSICVDMDVVKGKCLLDDYVGKELGQFKIEHKGKVYVSDTAYQWEGRIPTWSGGTRRRYDKFKDKFGHDFQLSDPKDRALLKTISSMDYKYKFDKEKMEIVNN